MIPIVKRWFAESKERVVANLSSSNSWIYRAYLHYIFQPNQNNIDGFLDRLSKSVADFQLVQIGANDGITHDPVHKFIKRDGWSGVLVEPQTWLVKNKLKPLYRNQPKIDIINKALGDKGAILNLYSIAFTRMRWASGLTRTDRNSLLHLFSEGVVQRRSKKYGIKIPDKKSEWLEQSAVECIAAQELIDQFGLKKIDLLMIDAEGFDAEVVGKFLDSEPKPWAIVFEQFHLSSEVKFALLERMEQCGYLHKTIGPNTIAVRKEIEDVLLGQSK